MSRLRSAAPGLAAGLAILLAPVLATGLLYLLRGPTGHFPGPRVPDALPLDALAAHGHVPLLVFAAVWIVTALLLGAGARALGLGRIAGALVLTMGIGVWLFVLNSFSIFVVDQVPVRHALAVATAGRAIYLAAGAAGAGGAILGRK